MFGQGVLAVQGEPPSRFGLGQTGGVLRRRNGSRLGLRARVFLFKARVGLLVVLWVNASGE